MRRRHLRNLVLILAYAWVAMIAIGSLWWPMGRDQGVYAWVGDVILDGGVPYRDAWDVKGPATFYTYALAQLLFGRNTWGVRVLDLVLVAMAAWIVQRLLRRHVEPPLAHTGPVVLVLLYLERGFWNTAQPDGWGGFMVILAAGVLGLGVRSMEPGDSDGGAASGSRGTLRRLVAGALVTLAALYKVTLVAFLLPVALYDLMLAGAGAGEPEEEKGREPAERRRRGGGRSLRSLVALVAGSVGAALAAVGLMAWRGSLDAFLDVQFRFNPAVHLLMQERPRSLHLELPEFLLAYALLPVVALAAVGLHRAWSRREPLAAFAAVALGAGLVTIVAQYKYYPYHWTPLYPPFAILAALGLDDVRRRIREELRRRGRGEGPVRRAGQIVALGGIVLLVLCIQPMPDIAGWRAFVFGLGGPESYYAFYGGWGAGDYSFPADLEVADYLRRHTDPDDTVLIWGFEPLVNYLADRRPPTRFGYDYPLVTGGDSEIRRRYRREFLADLRRSPPELVIVVERDRNNLMEESSRVHLARFPELYRFLLRNYEHETTIEDFAIWRRAGS